MDATNANGSGNKIEVALTTETLAQAALVAAGQRRINIIWEYTQSLISIAVVLANMIVAVSDGLTEAARPFPVILSSSLFLIVGFYFSRTNHASIGGVGEKPSPNYTGR